jgi:hypothetical protein
VGKNYVFYAKQVLFLKNILQKKKALKPLISLKKPLISRLKS